MVMEAPAPTRPKEETARLGKVIYEWDIRPLVEPDHSGQVIAIDVDSGDYAIAGTASAAAKRLRAQRPVAGVWLMRIGYRTLRHFGGNSLRRTVPLAGMLLLEGCVFHVKLPPVPTQSCHLFQAKVATPRSASARIG